MYVFTAACVECVLICVYFGHKRKSFVNWFRGSVVDLTWFFGSHDKELSVASLCVVELEERFPYWDNMRRDLCPSEAVAKEHSEIRYPETQSITGSHTTTNKKNRKHVGTSRRRTHAHQLLLFVRQPSGPKITHASILLSDGGRADLAEGAENICNTYTHGLMISLCKGRRT